MTAGGKDEVRHSGESRAKGAVDIQEERCHTEQEVKSNLLYGNKGNIKMLQALSLPLSIQNEKKTLTSLSVSHSLTIIATYRENDNCLGCYHIFIELYMQSPNA